MIPMARFHHLRFLGLLLVAFASGTPARAQLVFSGPATFGGTTGVGLFRQDNGQVTAINTGFVEHYFPWISRNNTLISFSSPDPVPQVGVDPSSDLYLHNLANGQTSRVLNFSTQVAQNFQTAFRPVSSAVSPNGQVVALGVSIQLNQGGNVQTTKELNIVDVATGIILANPTAGRGPVPDGLDAEFIGLSWDPGGTSFVTPTYVLVNFFGGFPQSLPGIVRWARDGSGNYLPTQISGPQFFNNNQTAVFHLYPAISPSGAGLAYFLIEVPDATFASQPARASIVRANANGSGASILATFDPGFYPAGMDWSADGNSLYFSLGSQLQVGGAFRTAAVLSTAQTYLIDSSSGSGFQQVPGTGIAFFPSVGSGGNTGGSGPPIRLALTATGPATYLLSATGVNASATYELRSSTTLAAGSFGAPQNFTGTQLMTGITVNRMDPQRFFQLFQ